MKKNVVIIGAGAIGRGFLPWKIDIDRYNLIFVDIDQEIIDIMNKNKRYSTFVIKNNKLEAKTVEIDKAFNPAEFSMALPEHIDLVFMAVRPNNVKDASNCLKGVSCPVILCENDPKTVDIVKEHLNHGRVYFAIPDVITSNTASSESLRLDRLAIHTEDGVLFIDERAGFIGGDITFLPEKELIDKQWTAKLFLHNTPHCVTSYLGALFGLSYIDEVMKHEKLKEIVAGSMNEMLAVLKDRMPEESEFLDWYANKEILRFADDLLHDPISRVARDPYRKLEIDGRLIGAAMMCFNAHHRFDNIMVGIVCAAICASYDTLNLADLKFDFEALKNNILSVFEVIRLKNTVIYDPIIEKLDAALYKIQEIIENNEKQI
ncbi:MAG: hypothetical protein FWE78_01500 [Methanimicrococcus sp.]|nr:hypothetical protein [Methanimicrococcus sp.]